MRYQIAPEDLIRIQREARDRGQEIVGYYPQPSRPPGAALRDRPADRGGGPVGRGYHVVVGVEKGERAVPTAWVFRDATQAFDEEPFEVE